MLKGLTLAVVPDSAAVLRSLLGVMAVAMVALRWGPPGSATAAAVAAAIAGATALQDSPRGRIPRVVAVSFLMGFAVLLGALTSAYSAVFVATVAAWCFGAAIPWALGARAGLIAGASAALLIIAAPIAPIAPTVASTLGASALVVLGGVVQAGLVAVWPQRRWRVQRDALTAAYRSLAADARKLADGAPPSSPDVIRLRRPELRTSVRSAVDLMRGHLNGHSPVFRHAVRLSVAMAAGCAVARYDDVAHGYWIPLTVLMVLRPETAHTYTRCVGRVAGNLSGIVVASSVLLLLHPGAVLSAVLAIVFVGASYAAAGFGYVALAAASTAAVVLLINIDRADETVAMRQLLFSVLVGGAMAVLAHVLLPDDGLTRLRQRAGELLKTEIDYAATVIKTYVHELDNPADALSAAWQRAFRARAAFEAAAGATRMESREGRHWLRSYRTALNAVTTACATLEANVPANPSAMWSREFVLAVDEYVESLCGDPPTPASPWTVDTAALAAADQRLRDAVSERGSEDGAARVLVAEVGTITRHLSAIAASPGPTAPR